MSEYKNRIVGQGEMPASQFTPSPSNWRVHPSAQQDALEGVLSEVGWVQRVIVNRRTGYIIDGHQRVLSALKRGDETPVPYLEVDLSEDEEALVLATIDPIAAMAASDVDKLSELLNSLESENDSVSALLKEIAANEGVVLGDEPQSDPGAAIDRAEEWVRKWGVEKGQLWQIGRHRLLCGDAYSADDQARLISDTKIDMLHIDPPYGIGIVDPEKSVTTATKHRAPGESRRTGATVGNIDRGVTLRNAQRQGLVIQPNLYPVIEGDDRPFDPVPFIDFASIVIMWGANYYAQQLPSYSGWICWDKRENITRNDFADGELAWTNQDKPMRIFYHLWNGLHKGSQHSERRLHPTEKPVALFEEIGKLYADGGVWCDLFAGSGAQLVAAERTGATCLAMECEPLYVATMIERLANMGIEPRLVNEE